MKKYGNSLQILPGNESTLDSLRKLSTKYAVSNGVSERPVKFINELFDAFDIIIKIYRLKDIKEMKIKRT